MKFYKSMNLYLKKILHIFNTVFKMKRIISSSLEKKNKLIILGAGEHEIFGKLVGI